MFKITEGKGFQMTFDNGWTISVQWGPINSCNRKATKLNPRDHFIWESNDAEVAIWDKDGRDYKFSNDHVLGRCSANDVAMWIELTSKLK